MKLVHDWRWVLKRSWSVHLNILGALFGAWAAYWGFDQYGMPRYISLPAAILPALAVVARIMQQRKPHATPD